MESASTSEIILDLITAAEQLPATAGPDVSKIQHLLKQLFVAATTDRTSMRNWVKEAKTERDCALEQLKTVQAEREDASKQLVEVRQKLEAAKDETERLRAEVTHFERMAVAAQKTARSGMNGAARDQGGEQNGMQLLFTIHATHVRMLTSHRLWRSSSRGRDGSRSAKGADRTEERLHGVAGLAKHDAASPLRDHR